MASKMPPTCLQGEDDGPQRGQDCPKMTPRRPMIQSDLIGQDTRQDTRPFRGPQRQRNAGGM
eukprot:9479048-Pyramimonas_sp.AAC.1